MDDDELLKQFGRNVKAERVRRGYTQDDFALILGVNREHVSKIECGKLNMSLKKINAVAKALKIDVSELLKFV